MAGDHRNVADLVRVAARTSVDKPALVGSAGAVTWAELDRLVDAVATGLRDRGLEAGARIGILLPNSVEFALTYFAVLRAGLVALPLNTAYTAAELAYQIDDAAASLVVTRAADVDSVQSAPVLVVGSADWDDALAGPAAAGSRGDAEDLAVLLYTSGTSGRPKGAMLSHRALLANLDQLAQIEPAVVAPDDV